MGDHITTVRRRKVSIDKKKEKAASYHFEAESQKVKDSLERREQRKQATKEHVRCMSHEGEVHKRQHELKKAADAALYTLAENNKKSISAATIRRDVQQQAIREKAKECASPEHGKHLRESFAKKGDKDSKTYKPV